MPVRQPFEACLGHAGDVMDDNNFPAPRKTLTALPTRTGASRDRSGKAVPDGAEASSSELLARHIDDLEGQIRELVDRRDRLLTEHDRLMRQIRALRRTEALIVESVGPWSEPRHPSEDALSTAWSRLWDQPRAGADRAGDGGPREAANRGADSVESLPEHGPSLQESDHVTQTREPARSRRSRWLLIASAAVILGGGPILVSWLVTSDRPATLPLADPSGPASVGLVPTTMPDVLGSRLPKATDLIVDAGLDVHDIRLVQGRDGRVVSTEPTPGEAVTVGTDVTISVGSG